MKISIIIVCHNRKDELKECIHSVLRQIKMPDEIIVVDNNSTDSTETLFVGEFSYPSIRYFKLDKNLECSQGRNFGLKNATGEILVFLDDDALLEPEDALQRIVDRFKKDNNIGILGFKIVNYYTKTILREDIPHTNKKLNMDKEFETSYFVGAGHAVKKEVFNKCGTYADNFFEELDLSFRAIDKGYKIIYFPEVTILHKIFPEGRYSREEKWIYTYRNRLGVCYKYLKFRHMAASTVIWFFKIIKESKSVVLPFKGLYSFISFKRGLIRKPISEDSLEYIKSLKGRIWY